MVGYLLLEDGTVYEGKAYGNTAPVVGALGFHTDMAGYEQLFMDPANSGRFMVMTYPIIGSYGFKRADYEGGENKAFAAAVIAKEFCQHPSHWACETDILHFMEEKGIFGFCHIDTRSLTRKIRDNGSMKALLTTEPVSDNTLELLRNATWENRAIQNTAASCYRFIDNHWDKSVAVLDFGSSGPLINQLQALHYNVHLFPWDASAEAVLSKQGKMLFVSHGGGDLTSVRKAAGQLKELFGKIPLFGIGMGAIALAIAGGLDIYRMPNGHRGSNYPVLCHASGKVLITAQNIGYAIVREALKQDVSVTHTNINDGAVDGFETDCYKAVMFLPGPESGGEVSPLLKKWTEEAQRDA